jgi:hypothetical protein
VTLSLAVCIRRCPSKFMNVKVFENSVRRRAFGSKKNEIVGSWIKLPNLYYSPNNIGMIKSRERICAGHVA